MKVLVACHCEEPVFMSYKNKDTDEDEISIYSHKLAFIKNPFGKDPQINPDGIELYYVDVSDYCKSYNSKYQYKGWEDIPKNYFDIIWYQFCPLIKLNEYKIEIDVDIFEPILTSSLSVLKPGGMIMTSLPKKKIGLVRQFIHTYFPDVNCNFVEDDKIPYCMAEMDIHKIPYTTRLEHIIDDPMLIITKKQHIEKPKGGKKSKSKKSTKSKKSKKSNKSTKSNRINIKK
jgi:hypothetical protein